MGYSTGLFLLDFAVLEGRVVPALRAWLVDGVVADWWRRDLAAYRYPAPAPMRYALARDLGPADTWTTIIDPVVGLVAVLDDDWWDETARTARAVWYDETLPAVEIALLSAATGGLAVGKINLSLELVPDEPYAEPHPLTPPPRPDDRVVDLVTQLDTGLSHLRHNSGSYGEGINGLLDPAGAADLDDALTAHGSSPATGTLTEIGAALATAPHSIDDYYDPRVLLAVHSMAHRARKSGYGLLHLRDPHAAHLGPWENGVLLPAQDREDGDGQAPLAQTPAPANSATSTTPSTKVRP